MTKRNHLPWRIASGLASAAFLFSGLASAVLAQQPGPMGPPPVKDPKFDTLERQNREATLRSAELAPALAKLDQKRIEAALRQMKEDFRRIQLVRNDVARNVLANKPFDYAVILGETAEINKRAERLKSFLLTTKAEGSGKGQKTEVEVGDTQMKGALARLCHLIDSFVENPALKNPRTVDVERSKKLIIDLWTIADLSSNLKKSAEKLAKIPR